MPRRLTWVLVVGVATLAASAAVAGLALQRLPARARGARGAAALDTVARRAMLNGWLRAPGGPFLYDRLGRVVFLHGVDVVYKHAPFEVYPDQGTPWNFSIRDARRIAALGFDVVRLGVIWAGLEPGTLLANDALACTPGRPGNPHQLDRAVLYRYLRRLKETVDLLARVHVFTILDMHQDVYSQVLGGEGAPPWAVCTDGVRPTRPPGRWSRVYGTPVAGIAFDHFWKNDVVGDLQGQFDEVWGLVARFFRNDPWVVGFDPYNEPFSTSILKYGGEHFDAQLECFYTGTAHVGVASHGAPPIHCPPGDPRTGVVAVLERNDPHALVFDEPDIYASRGGPTYLGPMPFKGLVFNVHVYCSARNPVTGNPVDAATCAAEDSRAVARRAEDRSEMASAQQPGGPAWFVSEFGATSDAATLRETTALFAKDLVGWSYWSWKYYRDPTGSADEALARATGTLTPKARVLSQTYAEAVAGRPLSMSFDVASGRFELRYRVMHRLRATRTPTPQAAATTLVVVPRALRYRHGYCVTTSGGRVVSRGRNLLEIANRRGATTVQVVVTALRGRSCPAAGRSRRPDPGSHVPLRRTWEEPGRERS